MITDAFDMASITDNYTPGEAALQSFMAGADIILMPNDLTQAYQAILNAVNSKKITQSRLDESVIRILTTKFKHGILTQEDLTVWEQPTATPSVTPAVTASPKAKKGKKNRESAKTIKKSTKNKSKSSCPLARFSETVIMLLVKVFHPKEDRQHEGEQNDV